jgi:serine/threonine protein kinase
MKEAPVQRGDVLAGKYRVESVLGVGGMGVVVEATHLELNESRAIKFMLPEALENAESVERFLREARASSRLRSEHVARVYDYGRLENGAPYMVMEYLEGTDLRSLLKQRGRVPVAEAVSYALQTCEALAEAHGNGIVHRDLKPANLFLTSRPDGTPCLKVLDFGISKVLGGGDHEMTRTQAVLGSPTYMSPEQMRSARDVDSRADIWSLGIILYRLVTGRLPFQAEGLTELVAQVLHVPPLPPSSVEPDLPAGLDAVLLRCLQRDLDKRWPDVGELALALLPFGAPEAVRSVERIDRLLASGPFSRDSQPSQRRMKLTGGPVSVPVPPSSISNGPSNTPWSSTSREGERTPTSGSGGGDISIRRWTFVGIAAVAGGLAIAGVASLALSVHLGAGSAAAQSRWGAREPPKPPGEPPADVPSAAPVETAPPPATASADAPPAPSPEPPPVVPAATAEPAAPPAVPVATASARVPPPPVARPQEAPPVLVKPAPVSKPAPAPTAQPAPPATTKNPHRMFGSDN